MHDADLGEEPPGATPLEDEELEGLKPAWIATRGDLNEAEFDNILAAQQAWDRRRLNMARLLDDKTIRDLHRDMFGEVWDWAGTYRRTEKNIGIDPIRISVAVHDLVEDAKYWFDTDDPLAFDNAAVKFHHKLVSVHPFPNGNGRHAREMTDLLLRAVSRPPFTWGGGANLGSDNAVRNTYIRALREADFGDYATLNEFVRS
ncbi:MAG TPA: mobile mystery protein B [Nocardioides sp.]|uniref:mobile mystery protein B n=1 Tax=uncultured Nocardioides sp. TaxID=198441 RepID=UPI000EDF8A49|nr:mobile mystery protein B [uncultured Nocardioides sp.]HCB03873.1 mobile mystery protein B [Nocardioides sp.]HRD62638.1 mobile mystery protein B [Nocardioides sp.]HRI97475.1 mobile mystery protein B [Nocardioides sp.]